MQHLHSGLQASSLASTLSAKCTINGAAAPTSVIAPISAGEVCTDVSDYMYSSTDQDSTTGELDTTNSLCKVVLACTGLALNTGMSTWRDNHWDTMSLGPANFGGYACGAGSLLYCDVEHKRMVASPDGNGCVAAPSHYWHDGAGNGVDATGMALAAKCNPMGAEASELSGRTACTCLTGYSGASCEQCAPGFVSTPVLLGDGVHSLTAVGEMGLNLYASETHDYQVQGAYFDYNNWNDYGASVTQPASFCIKDVTLPAPPVVA